ncbi:uncharacterized protein HHUB_5123 (plasmid) [Halobacterium hubeiense]|jgi:hypothetical protein|uniref:Uncharacterized protein n=1 Tax=Halobacterium hubeiense TaxID=1407499 RepID=A0A0U5H8F3_9EURY|nr:uncharacterized protein HHUB_5123 [Halobacterium hubeiense]
MTGSDTEASSEDASTPPWRLLGVGGALSLCCLFAAPTAGAAAAGGTAAALGGGLVRIVVTALTAGVIGALYWLYSSGDTDQSCAIRT